MQELRAGRRRIIHQGGQWSGKTVNILGAYATLSTEDDTPTITTITAQSFPHLKGGALRDFETYVYPDFKHAIKQYHKTDHIFTFHSGSIMEFKVFENEMAARGQKRHRLFVNEANSFPWMTFFQLDSRSEQTVIDYNPSLRFWAHENLSDPAENIKLISDHRHNPFLTEQKHREIENYYEESKADGGELFKVYSRGLTGNITGIIFPDWEMIADEDFPQEDCIYSVDFGYTIDPTCIMKQVKIGNTLFVDEIAYEAGIPAKQIKQILIGDGYDARIMPLYCEHDPDMIKQLRNIGVEAFPARKGIGSVKAGIDLLKQFKVKYTARSRNLHRERGLYVWETEKDTGKSTNIPVDKNNHTFDAIRYGAYTVYLKEAA